MRVNSAFTGFITNRLVDCSGITKMMLAVLLMISSFTAHSGPELQAKQVNLIIRQIGHRLLLQAGDSTSRVLPVTENKQGTFLLRFENEFIFNHDSLLVLSKGLLPKTQFPSGYTVKVHDCTKGGIVYGFQINNTSPDILACSGRGQPAGCYTIEFAFPNFNEDIKQKTADISQPTELVKVGHQEASQKPETSEVTYTGNDIGQRTKQVKPNKADIEEVNLKSGESQKTIAYGYPLINVLFVSIFILMSVLLLIRHFKGKYETVPVPNRNQAIVKEPVTELAALGSFLFNIKGQRLLLGSEVISLTDKECRVLELLHRNFGELIPRETLMQEIWISEGVFTGRSLDVFVSKLRKKLSYDPELKITNVHGKGYRLGFERDPGKKL